MRMFGTVFGRLGVVAVCGLVLSGGVWGQAGAGAGATGGASGAAPAAAVPVQVDAAKSLNAALARVETEEVSLAEAMPAEKYGFAPSKAIFAAGMTPAYDGVRTFGEMVAHVAQANFYYGSLFSGLKPDVDMKAIGAGVDRATAVASLKASFVFLHKAAGTITAANAFEGVGPPTGLMTRVSVFALMWAHNRDHYGQLVEYGRMNGVVPPASRK